MFVDVDVKRRAVASQILEYKPTFSYYMFYLLVTCFIHCMLLNHYVMTVFSLNKRMNE